MFLCQITCKQAPTHNARTAHIGCTVHTQTRDSFPWRGEQRLTESAGGTIGSLLHILCVSFTRNHDFVENCGAPVSISSFFDLHFLFCCKWLWAIFEWHNWNQGVRKTQCFRTDLDFPCWRCVVQCIAISVSWIVRCALSGEGGRKRWKDIEGCVGWIVFYPSVSAPICAAIIWNADFIITFRRCFSPFSFAFVSLSLSLFRFFEISKINCPCRRLYEGGRLATCGFVDVSFVATAKTNECTLHTPANNTWYADDATQQRHIHISRNQ